jgi:hypothetical protein
LTLLRFDDTSRAIRLESASICQDRDGLYDQGDFF